MGILFYGAGALVLGAAAVLWMIYNRLVALDERCKTAFADIDVLIKHRHSLIPGLVETVRGFAGHESSVLIEVTRARAAALQAARPEMRLEAEAQVGQSITSLFALVEKYPDLQASPHFRDLRVALTDTENRITASRRFYNLAVNELNASLRQFPGNLVAGISHIGRRQVFDLGVERILLDDPVAIRF